MGWVGFQPNQNQAELALVLHPNWWGLCKACFQKFIEHNSYCYLEQVIVLLPEFRRNLRDMEQLGFHKKDVTFIDGNCCVQFFRNLEANY